MFRVSQHPSSGVLEKVTAASGTDHNTGTATSLQRGLKDTLEASGWIFIKTRFKTAVHELYVLMYPNPIKVEKTEKLFSGFPY